VNMRDDVEFGRFLVSMNYADGSPELWSQKVSTGLLVYMWESWQVAKGRKIRTWQSENDRAPKG
jgi:hypothetical protein